MRTVINISVPITLRKEIDQEVKIGGYASVSEFFRAILREHKENLLLRNIETSRHEFKTGHSKLLHSLKDIR